MDNMLISIVILLIGIIIGFVAGYFHRMNIEEEEETNGRF